VVVTVNLLTVQFGFYHFLAFPIGVVLGSVGNWLLYSRFVWRSTRRGATNALREDRIA
jgi:hypothetical protein